MVKIVGTNIWSNLIVVVASAAIGISLGHGIAAADKKPRKTRTSDHSWMSDKIYGIDFGPKSGFHQRFAILRSNFGGPGELGISVEHDVKTAQPRGLPGVPDVIKHVVVITITDPKPGGGPGDKIFVQDDVIGHGQDAAGEGNWMQIYQALYTLKPGAYWVRATWYNAEKWPGQKLEIAHAGCRFVVK